MARNVLRHPVSAHEILSSGSISNSELSNLVATGTLQAYRKLDAPRSIERSRVDVAADGIGNVQDGLSAPAPSDTCYKVDTSIWNITNTTTIHNWDGIVFNNKDAHAVGYNVTDGTSYCMNCKDIDIRNSGDGTVLRRKRRHHHSSNLSKYFESDDQVEGQRVATGGDRSLHIIKSLELRIKKLETIVRSFVSAAPSSGPMSDSSEEKLDAPKKTYKFGEVTQAAAASMCGVSVRTFQSWERGERSPKITGFPGRSSLTALLAWSYALKDYRRMVRPAKAMGRATPMSPTDIDRFATKNAWDADD